MAVTGFILVGFVIGHFLGNAQVFLGPKALNDYAEFLHHGTHGLLWVARVVLLGSVVLHIGSSFTLYARNSAARPHSYQVKKNIATTFAARTMMLSGPWLLGFLFFHLAHLTFGGVTAEFSESDVYNNVVSGFQVPWISAIYIISMVSLGNHLFHGTWSMFQTLGLNHSAYNQLIKNLALAIVVLVTLGNISIPVAVLSGVLKTVPAAASPEQHSALSGASYRH